MAADAVTRYLNDVMDDFDHMAGKKPFLADRYRKILAVKTQRSDAIAAGIAKAKPEKAAQAANRP